MNSLDRVALLISPATTAFIEQHFTEMVDAVVAAASGEAEASIVPEDLAPFHFTKDDTPNKRGKVTWNPLTNAWMVKYSDKIVGGKEHLLSFKVRCTDGAVEEQRKKVDAYVEACKQWNERDKTKQQRIKLDDKLKRYVSEQA